MTTPPIALDAPIPTKVYAHRIPIPLMERLGTQAKTQNKKTYQALTEAIEIYVGDPHSPIPHGGTLDPHLEAPKPDIECVDKEAYIRAHILNEGGLPRPGAQTTIQHIREWYMTMERLRLELED